MELNNLTAISPVDGRYRKTLSALDEYFSEYGLMKYRVLVEVSYFLFLSEKGFFSIPQQKEQLLKKLAAYFSLENAERIKEIEKVTNHDVKAVEYFIKESLDKIGLSEQKEWVHFGLTSQDVNNTAIPLSWKDCLERSYLPAINELKDKLQQLAHDWKDIAMLARTHGQPASPTLLGKEFMVFVERLNDQLQLFSTIPYSAKFGGATGNFNAHHVAFPDKDWVALSDEFVSEKLGLKRDHFSTQIEHYDNLGAHFDNIRRINNILIDFARDCWQYISLGYFGQKIKAGEVGSSAMPHKVNPIDFENAEGNLGMANAMFSHLSGKLPISRLQRDLTDSTVLRNIGVPLAQSVLAISSLMKGIGKLLLHEDKIREDLENNWEVVAEALQTILRRERYPQPYEALKELTRGKAHISQQDIASFIDKLEISDSVKKELKAITPWNYTGITLDF